MNKLKLLYAEDEERTRKDHIVYLQSRYDLEIFEAKDGLEALELYKDNEPDIVLTDITMPNMCGLELAREIRKISSHTKIIILSAHSEHDKLMQAFDSNVVNYLIKPINRKKLRESMDIAIETIAKNTKEKNSNINLSKNAMFDMKKQIFVLNDEVIKLSKSESKLLNLLCENKNKEIDAYDIFLYVWNDFEKEFSADSVRTLVKKLRKKLPAGVLKNIYGGFYKIEI